MIESTPRNMAPLCEMHGLNLTVKEVATIDQAYELMTGQHL